MRLISCHIENFGKLHDVSMTFSQGMNCFCEENGWGKSTFAGFLCAMFYGLHKGKGSKDLEKYDREKYMPWQGGACGGQIVFAVGDKKYILTRTFGPKDWFELRDAETNLISEDYSEKIGEELFGLDKESFKYTIYISQSDCSTQSTDAINAGLGDLTDIVNDMDSYNSAAGKLEKYAREGMKAVKSAESIISEKERRDREGMILADNISALLSTLAEAQKRRKELEIEKADIEQKRIALQERLRLLSERGIWDKMQKRLADRKVMLEEAIQFFPGAVPSEEALQEMQVIYRRELAESAAAASIEPTAEERREFAVAAVTFPQDLPGAETFERQIAAARELQAARREQRAKAFTEAEEARLAELEEAFAGEAEDAPRVWEMWNKRNRRSDAIPANKASLANMERDYEEQLLRAKRLPVIFYVGLVLLVVGIVMLFVTAPLVGAALIVLGCICAAFAWIQKSRQPVVERSPEHLQMQQLVENDEIFCEEAEAKVLAYLAKHHRSFDEDTASYVLQSLMTENDERKRLLERKREAVPAEAVIALEESSRDIHTFLQGFGVNTQEDSYVETLYALQNKAERYNALCTKIAEYETADKKHKETVRSLLNFLQQHGMIPMEDLQKQFAEIVKRTDDVRDLEREIEGITEEILEFEKDKDMDAVRGIEAAADLPSEEEIVALSDRNAQETKQCMESLLENTNRLEELQEAYALWEENKAELEALKQKSAEDRERAGYAQKALELLAKAKESMTARYADPVLTGVKECFETITGREEKGLHLDAQMQITVDEQGRQRELKFLSSGYRDLVGFSMRMALIEAMFKEEQPMLILDDPFCNLDDKKIEAAIKLLRKKAEMKQIIYFTCSETRKL